MMLLVPEGLSRTLGLSHQTFVLPVVMLGDDLKPVFCIKYTTTLAEDWLS